MLTTTTSLTYAQATLLGAIQGLTEFLPVSSSAHLALAPHFFAFPDPGLTFDVALHLGTLLAVLVYYRITWINLIKNALKEPTGSDGRVLGSLVLATLPAVISGLLLEKTAETAFRDPKRIAACLIAFSFVMLWANRKTASRTWRAAGPTALIIVGMAQALALMPGVSRSGATVSAALLIGLSRAEAAELSFLMATPIVAGAAVLKLRHLSGTDITPIFLCGVATSALFGFLAVGLFLRLLPRSGLKPYAFYRIALGVLTIALF